MSRRAWGSVSFTSLVVSAAAGTYLFTQMDRWMPVAPVPAPVPISAPIAVPPPAPAAEAKTEAPPAETNAEKPASADSQTSLTRNILFRIPKPNATSVYITGEFNGWKRQSMRKNGKVWEISVTVKPGTYKYMFVVNDKRVRDPNNKNAKDGQSVIVVKPLQSVH